MKMKKILYFIFIVCLFLLPNFSRAEIEIGVMESDISVDIWPENPEPYQDVKINLSSYATDLNKAMIEWRSGNKTILSGYGKTSYSFRASGPNTSTPFEIIITPSQTGERISKTFTIHPSEVEVLWETVDGYMPPFYKGKSLITSEGIVKVVAIPNTNSIKSGKGNVSYSWKRNDKSVLSASGFNKDAYIFETSVLNKNEKIDLHAESVDGNYSASKELNLPIYNPVVIFYKKSPTEGILYNNAVDENTTFNEDEITLVAEPYFLALNGNEDLFDYRWSINGDRIDTPSRRTEITVRPTSRGGFADISVVFENIDKLFQKVIGYIKITL